MNVSCVFAGIVVVTMFTAQAFVLAAKPSMPSTTTAPTTAPTTNAADKPVPVLYAEYLDPKPLEDEQLATILKKAATAQPEDAAIWFVLVLYHRELDGQPRFRASVYFTPTKSVGRQRRRGETFRYDSKLYEWQKVARR